MAAPPDIAGPVVILTLIGFGLIYTFGYVRAVMHRARSDYVKTKAAVPGLRNDWLAALWRAVKGGFWVVIGVAILLTWAYRDVRSK